MMYVLFFQEFLINESVLKVGVATVEDCNYLHQDYNLQVSLLLSSSATVTEFKPS